MIENLMKAVKSSRKKKGINITIGAVVGFLLSCAAVMGADEYLWIKNDGSGIKFNTIITTTTDGAGGNWNEANPYKENSWIENTYINNITLSSSTNNGIGEYSRTISYGLRLSGDLGNFNFINNGIVSGSGTSSFGYGYGIRISGTTGVTIANEGVISGSGIGTGSSSGSDYSSAGSYSEGYGIRIYVSSEATIKNEGVISGSGTGSGDGYGYGSGYGFGISISGTTTTGITIKNEGVVSGSGRGTGNSSSYSEGYGIDISGSNEATITNTGVIYGSTNAVKNNSGTINNAFNYGILADGNSSEEVVDGLTIVTDSTPNQNKISNYGLIIKDGTPIIPERSGEQSVSVIVGYNDDGTPITKKMYINNNTAIDGTGSIEGDKEKHILNALTNTYKVTGTSKVTDSIIKNYLLIFFIEKYFLKTNVLYSLLEI